MANQQHPFRAAATAPWIVVCTHPHRELAALENLRRQKFEGYCPMIRRQVSHARRVSSVLRPLFPSYLFVQANEQLRQWRPILSTFGVRSIVRAGEDLSFIDAAFVASLKARELEGAIVRPPQPYQLGQRVQIASGPFDGVVATILALEAKDRLVVLLQLMNRGIKVRVSSDAVTPA